jgi:hypothetical protein
MRKSTRQKKAREQAWIFRSTMEGSVGKSREGGKMIEWNEALTHVEDMRKSVCKTEGKLWGTRGRCDAARGRN